MAHWPPLSDHDATVHRAAAAAATASPALLANRALQPEPGPLRVCSDSLGDLISIWLDQLRCTGRHRRRCCSVIVLIASLSRERRLAQHGGRRAVDTDDSVRLRSRSTAKATPIIRTRRKFGVRKRTADS